MKKLLSIVIPTYNMEALLDQCLTSLIVPDKEKREKLDVIVVIDGATDRSSEIAHGYESRYPETFRILDKKNGNYGSCVNAALPLALSGGGEFVRVLDADDSYYTENISDYLDVLESCDADLVLTPCHLVNLNGNVIENRSFAYTKGLAFPVSELDSCILMHSITYRSSIFRTFSYHQTEGISYTDQEWSTIPMQGVKTVYYYDKPIYRYLIGREGQTMDSGILMKKLGDEAKSLFSQLNALKDIPQDCPARPWIQKMIDDRTSRLYRFGLSRQAHLNLEEFDRTLKKDFPSEYKRASDFTMEVGIANMQMNFVSMWRKVRSRRGMWLFPKYILFILASRLLK